jgi:hypothetical protein
MMDMLALALLAQEARTRPQAKTWTKLTPAQENVWSHAYALWCVDAARGDLPWHRM